MTHQLAFTVGPVQGFVAQARRTRDLWAGSWLLSYLCESALVTAETAGGNAVIPFRKTEHGVVTSKQTSVGGIPNRFEVRFTGEDSEAQARRAGAQAKDAFQLAWQKVADAVFEHFICQHLNLGRQTKEIWDRQIRHFWELSWVVGVPSKQAETLGALAANRKAFRNVPVAAEGGTKCSLMPTLQEISGQSGRRQKDFWNAVRDASNNLDFSDNEKLCAIAMVKRLFPRVVKKAIGDDISPNLKDQIGWSSTAFLAATPWLKSLSGEARQAAEDYQKSACGLGYGESDYQAAKSVNLPWATADGQIWFQSAIQRDQPSQSIPHADKERGQHVRQLSKDLKKLYDKAGKLPQEEGEALRSKSPIPYYGLLLMDGDSMGALLKELKQRADAGQQSQAEQLSESLVRFTSEVDKIVTQHDGRTIYAGGDDVLALLPAANCLPAAEDLRTAYQNSFGQESAATISAAVAFTHWRHPLRQAIRTAHHLLDDIAKSRTGRDSIAVAIIQGSGLNAIWSAPWDVYLGSTEDSYPSESNRPSPHSLHSMLKYFGSDREEMGEEATPPFGASFLYSMRHKFARLLSESEDRPGVITKINVGHDPLDHSMLLRDLAHAEYRRRMSKSSRKENGVETTELKIDQLMSLSRSWKRTKQGGQPATIDCDYNTFAFDGWRVARFLKQIEEGRIDDEA